jgi:hypothetical protein
MPTMVESLLQDLDGPALGQIARQIGADQETTGRAVSAALPAIVSALARHASTADGAAAVHDSLAQGGHDGSLLDDLTGFLGGARAAAPAAAPAGIPGMGDLLGQILGGRQASVHETLGRGTGLDAASMARLFTILMPIVMAAIGRARRQNDLDSTGLGGLLAGEQDQMHKAAPDAMGMLGQILDANHDGSIADDVARLGGGLLGGLLGRKQ